MGGKKRCKKRWESKEKGVRKDGKVKEKVGAMMGK